MACMRDGFEADKLLDDRFLTVSPLNHGSFGMVFAAKDTWTDDDVAVKCITKPGVQENFSNCPAAVATDDRSEELAIHSHLPPHHNTVNLIHHFETGHHQYMVLELCGNGDLYEAIRLGRGPLETEHVRDFMLQLVDAIDHLHSNGVYHRDIKPENIFLTSSGSMKLGDFGLATTETWSTEFAVGSDRYMAPEQYDRSVHYGYGYSPASADVWAIGIVLLNVLFQRNPFAVPTEKDPLFADFATDRQTLFDVFPTMSQDTYNVIRHSLALDPANRSLAAVREALKSVLSFTTDDESLDDFCTEQNEIVPVATIAREPLRTPSVTSPTAQEEAQLWTKGLTAMQKPVEQLPTIPDDEHEMFPGSVSSNWQYVDADEASLSSNLDSGLGMSYKSSKSVASKSGSNFVGSLPIAFSRPGKPSLPYRSTGFSKSWSDLYDEEHEIQEAAKEGYQSLTADMDISRINTAKPSTPQLVGPVEDGHGSATPRLGRAEIDRTALSSGTVTPMAEERPALPKTRSSIILDKWAALGNFRRAKQETSVTPSVTPATPRFKYSDAFASFTSFGSNKKQPEQPQQQQPELAKTRDQTASWRKGDPSPVAFRSHSAGGRSQERKERQPSPKLPLVPATPELWSLDNNWRDHKQLFGGRTHSPTEQQPRRYNQSAEPPFTLQSRPLDKAAKDILPANYEDDIGEPEWVGGWKDFHL